MICLLVSQNTSFSMELNKLTSSEIEKMLTNSGCNLELLIRDFPNQKIGIVNNNLVVIFNPHISPDMNLIDDYIRTFLGASFKEKYGIDYSFIRENHVKFSEESSFFQTIGYEVFLGESVDEYDRNLAKKLALVKKTPFFSLEEEIQVSRMSSIQELTSYNFKLFLALDIVSKRSGHFWPHIRFHDVFAYEPINEDFLLESYLAASEILELEDAFRLENGIINVYDDNVKVAFYDKNRSGVIQNNGTTDNYLPYWRMFLPYVLDYKEIMSIYPHYDKYEFFLSDGSNGNHKVVEGETFDLFLGGTGSYEMKEAEADFVIDKIVGYDLSSLPSFINIRKKNFLKLNNFTDIDYRSKYLSAIEFCIENKIFNGSNNKLNPKSDVSKAEFVTGIINYFGYENISNIDNSFSDTAGKWYHQSMEIARENNIISGNRDGSSGALEKVTIGMALKIIANAFYPDVKYESSYRPEHWLSNTAYGLEYVYVIDEIIARESIKNSSRTLNREEAMNLIFSAATRLESYKSSKAVGK